MKSEKLKVKMKNYMKTTYSKFVLSINGCRLLMLVFMMCFPLFYANAQDDTISPEQLKKITENAEAGDADAQSTLGGMYLVGIGVAKDEKKAAEWIAKAAEQGDADAQSALGGMYLEGRGVAKDEKMAAEWIAKAAEQGNSDAQFVLGSIYMEGRGVARDEKKEIQPMQVLTHVMAFMIGGIVGITALAVLIAGRDDR